VYVIATPRRPALTGCSEFTLQGGLHPCLDFRREREPAVEHLPQATRVHLGGGAETVEPNTRPEDFHSELVHVAHGVAS
jgi:hypothetical protein